jgi:hypothetical protein
VRMGRHNKPPLFKSNFKSNRMIVLRGKAQGRYSGVTYSGQVLCVSKSGDA